MCAKQKYKKPHRGLTARIIRRKSGGAKMAPRPLPPPVRIRTGSNAGSRRKRSIGKVGTLSKSVAQVSKRAHSLAASSISGRGIGGTGAIAATPTGAKM